jgi:hypothetical protein
LITIEQAEGQALEQQIDRFESRLHVGDSHDLDSGSKDQREGFTSATDASRWV